MHPHLITVENEGLTNEERGIIPFKDVPPNTLFRMVMFENDRFQILSTSKIKNWSHFNFFGESVYAYEIAYVGKLVEGKVVMFEERDITYHDISIKYDDFECIIVPV